jgi:energy-coupling factor transport system substrate-specific component
MSAFYSITSIALGLIVGIGVRKKKFVHFYGFMKAASLTMFTALVVSVPVNLIINNGYTGNKWGDGVFNYLLDKEWPVWGCAIFGQLAIEFADKVLTIAAVYLAILIKRTRDEEESDKKIRHGTAAGTALILAITLGMAMPVTARADNGATSVAAPDYNDYVQSIYSSNNGLPCGEANDIAQTNDGVLWIGTYAGLYRYNGREFRWVDSYESVKNVNCLYVDEEGRLWIGTNDNGLSIVIREEVANVLDQSEGLPSNSVRSIVRATDGYYYVGTTSSMQILVMNNGLKAVNTLSEINYAESVAADEKGNVAAISNEGKLFLMRSGEIVGSIMCPNTEEIFKSCAFSPDGVLMVGTTTNHIYRYDIFGHSFKQIEVITCEDVDSINNLNYLEN